MTKPYLSDYQWIQISSNLDQDVRDALPDPSTCIRHVEIPYVGGSDSDSNQEALIPNLGGGDAGQDALIPILGGGDPDQDAGPGVGPGVGPELGPGVGPGVGPGALIPILGGGDPNQDALIQFLGGGDPQQDALLIPFPLGGDADQDALMPILREPSVSDTSEPSISYQEALSLVINFVETNKNIETLTIGANNQFVPVNDLGRWRTLVLAAFRNPNIGKFFIDALLLQTTVDGIAQVLDSAPANLESLTLFPGREFVPTQDTMQQVATAISSITALKELCLDLDSDIFKSAIFETLTNGGCSSLQKLEMHFDNWESGSNQNEDAPLLGLGRYLKSDNSSSLRRLDLSLSSKVGAAGMEGLVDGLASNSVVRTLGLRVHSTIEDDAMRVFASFMDSDDCKLKTLDLKSPGRQEPFSKERMEEIMGPSCTLQRLVLPPCFSDGNVHLSSNHLRSLRVFLDDELGLVSGNWAQALVDGIKSCPSLSALEIMVSNQGSLPRVDLQPLLDTLVAPSAGSRLGLEEFSLVTLYHDHFPDSWYESALLALASALQSPGCRLKKLRVSSLLNDQQMLSLFQGVLACQPLRELQIESIGAYVVGEMVSAEGWLSVCSMIPALTLETICINRIFIDLIMDQKGTIQEALLTGLKSNKSIYRAKFVFWQDGQFDAKVNALVYPRKVAKIAKALRDGSLPGTVVPGLFQMVARDCKYLPEIEEGPLCATILLSLLQARPKGDIMHHAKSYLLNAGRENQPTKKKALVL